MWVFMMDLIIVRLRFVLWVLVVKNGLKILFLSLFGMLGFLFIMVICKCLLDIVVFMCMYFFFGVIWFVLWIRFNNVFWSVVRLLVIDMFLLKLLKVSVCCVWVVMVWVLFLIEVNNFFKLIWLIICFFFDLVKSSMLLIWFFSFLSLLVSLFVNWVCVFCFKFLCVKLDV